MNDRSYGRFVSILSLIAIAISSYPVFAISLCLIFKINLKADFIGYFVRFGWILGLVLALISPVLTQRIKDERTKRFAINRFSNALGASLLWIILFFIILLTRGHSR